MSDYLTRIGRLTELDVNVPEPPALPAYPPRRELLLDIPRHTIDVAEFFELHGCDMGALVGFRNSPLGRVQSASQRLGYETAWLAAVHRCGAEAAEWLAELAAVKQESLPALFWNATFAAEEMRVAFGAAGPRGRAGLAERLRDLGDTLTRVQEGGFRVDDLERLLGELRQASWLGPARRDWSRWRRYLDAAAAMLTEAAPKLCLNRRPTPRARWLRNVFLAFYIERIQPELARGLGEHETWVAELERLSERLGAVTPPAYRAWYRSVLSPADPASEWRRTRAAVVNHAEAWQGLFAHCRIEPAPGVGQD